MAGAAAILIPFNFSTNFESTLARFLAGGVRGALNGGTIGFVQGAATTALQDSTWENGASIGLTSVLANGWTTALTGMAIGAPLEAVIAAIRPFEPRPQVLHDGEVPRTRGVNDEVGPPPTRENAVPTNTSGGGGRATPNRSINQEVIQALRDRLSRTATDAEIAAVLLEMQAGETITQQMIADTRSLLAGNNRITRAEFFRRMREGREFNLARRGIYDFNEVYVFKANGNGYWIVDSYGLSTNGFEIVSRKFSQLADLQESTVIGYLDELLFKYPPGARIASVPSTSPLLLEQSIGADGIPRLMGQMYLEVPIQNQSIPQALLDAASQRSIFIRDVNGVVLNPPLQP